MLHFYSGYHWFGMHIIWWFVWIAVLGTIFGRYETAPRKRGRDSGRA